VNEEEAVRSPNFCGTIVALLLSSAGLPRLAKAYLETASSRQASSLFALIAIHDAKPSGRASKKESRVDPRPAVVSADADASISFCDK
jgi:hypothetical protein